MATTTVTRPAVIPRPSRILRQGLVIAALLVMGVSLGMALDSGRGGVIDASGLTRGQEAAAERLAGQAAALDNARGLNAAAERLQGLADQILATSVPSAAPVDLSSVFYDPQASRATFGGVPIEGHYSPELSTWIFGPAAPAVEHGAFTPMTYRDPANVQQRFVGGDANLDPNVLPIAGLGEHGAFTPMTYRDPSVVTNRFVGIDANLDPDVAALGRGAHSFATHPTVGAQDGINRFLAIEGNLNPTVVSVTGPTYDPATSSIVPAGTATGGFYDPQTSIWVE